MGEVRQIQDPQWPVSKSQLAEIFGMGRDTVSERLRAGEVRQLKAKRGGSPTYPLGEAARALIGADAAAVGSGVIDPTKYKPTDRHAWYRSENERLKSETEMGNLVPAGEVHAQLAAVAKITVRTLETLPDVVERDICKDPRVIAYLIELARKTRSEIAKLVADIDEEPEVVRVSE